MTYQTAVRVELKLILCFLAIFVFAMWAYSSTTENAFVWDSTGYLNGHLTHFSSLGWENLKWMATSLEFYNWHPFTWLSWAFDYQIYRGLNPWGFHLSNNLLHALNAGILFFLILMVFGFIFPVSQKFTISFDNKALISALFASVLFAIHPQHVESVAWVAERKDLLCQLFMMLTIMSYMKYVVSEKSYRKRWYCFTLGLYFCAVLSKPMAVTLPAVLLVLDIYPLARSQLIKTNFKLPETLGYPRLVIEKLPFFALSALLIVLTMKAQQFAVQSIPLGSRLLNALHSVLLYIEKFFIPVSLNPYYPYYSGADEGVGLDAILMVAVMLGTTLAVLYTWKKRRPALSIALAVYLITLSPVLGLIQVGMQGAADRYSYFPTLPFYLLVAGGLYKVLRTNNVPRIALSLVVSVAVILLFTVQTKQQISVWKNELNLWGHVAKLTPMSRLAQNNLGIAYKNLGDYDTAIQHFEAGEEYQTGPTSMRAWRAITYMHLGRFPEAINNLVGLGGEAETRLELVVDESCIQYNIGWSYAHLQMYQEARELFNRVDSASKWRSSAESWVASLNSKATQVEGGDLPSDLPGLCEELIPSQGHFVRTFK